MKTDNEKFYPSGGTEGCSFIETWCANCKKDTQSRGGETYCTILTNSLIGKQPKQWEYIDGTPICRSFVNYKEKTKIKRHTEKLNVKTLF